MRGPQRGSNFLPGGGFGQLLSLTQRPLLHSSAAWTPPSTPWSPSRRRRRRRRWPTTPPPCRSSVVALEFFRDSLKKQFALSALYKIHFYGLLIFQVSGRGDILLRRLGQTLSLLLFSTRQKLLLHQTSLLDGMKNRIIIAFLLVGGFNQTPPNLGGEADDRGKGADLPPLPPELRGNPPSIVPVI